MDIKESLSKVPAWGWVAGGGLILGLIFLMNRGSSAGGGSTMTSTGGVAPDANSILSQLQDAANQLGSNTGSGGSTGGGSTGSAIPPITFPGGGTKPPYSGGGGSTGSAIPPITFPGGGTKPPYSGGGSTGSTPTGGTTTVKTITGYTAHVSNKTGLLLYGSKGGTTALSQRLYSGTITTSKPQWLNGVWWYQIKSSSNRALIGKWFKATRNGVSWSPIYTTTTKPATTSTTNTVQSSNNAVR